MKSSKPFQKRSGKPGGKPGGFKGGKPGYAGKGGKGGGDRGKGSGERETGFEKPRTDRPWHKPAAADARKEGPRGEKRFDKPYGDKPRGDKPRSDKPRGDRPFGDKPRGDKPRFDKPRFDKPRSDKPRSDKPFEARGEKPAFEKRSEKPAFEKRREAGAASPRISGPLLWGFHAVREAWLNPRRRILRLLVTDAGMAGFEETLGQTDLKRPNAELIDKGAFERMMPPGAVHQGIAALVEPLPTRDAHDLIADLAEDAPATLLILDQVTDPHNVGAILRSAAAFGARGVILQDRHAPELTGVLAKTASGAADVIPVAVETNLSRAIELLQENGFFVVGLDEDGDALADMPAQNRVALVLGAEGTGLRRLVADHCDALVSLPTQGSIRSLNVSNAAAIALYALKIAG